MTSITLPHARAVLPAGRPQVYYVGALAGKNDMELLKRTNVGRDTQPPLLHDLRDRQEPRTPVVKALNALARFRNELPASTATSATRWAMTSRLRSPGTVSDPPLRSRSRRPRAWVSRTHSPSPRSSGRIPLASTAPTTSLRTRPSCRRADARFPIEIPDIFRFPEKRNHG